MPITKKGATAPKKTTTKSTSSNESNELEFIASFTGGRKPVLTPAAVMTPTVVKRTKRNALFEVKATDGEPVQFWASTFPRLFQKVNGNWHLVNGARCEGTQVFPPEENA